MRRGRVRSEGNWKKTDTGWNTVDSNRPHREGRISLLEKDISNHIRRLTSCLLSPFSGIVTWPSAATAHSFTRCYDLLNSGTLKYSSPAHWSTEAKFLPGIIKVNRILMGPGRLVKTLPGPGSAVLLLPLSLPNAVRLHIQAPAK